MRTRTYRQVLLLLVTLGLFSQLARDVYVPRDYRPYDSTFTIPGNLVVGGTTTATGQITATAGLKIGATPTQTSGTGSPEGVVTAPVGSVFMRTNGAAGTTFYVKESGAGNTGWTALSSGTTYTGGDHITIAGTVISLSQIATARFLGRTTAGTGNVEDLTATQATALLNTFTTTLKGLVPAPGASSGFCLKDDATWSSCGTVTSSAQVDTFNLADSGATWTKPAAAKRIEVTVVGGGGGGGGGRYGVNGTSRVGGGGGGGAHVAHAFFDPNNLPASCTVTIGAGGTGGTGAAAPTNGTAGGNSEFCGSVLRAFGGGGGQAGQAAATTGGGGGGGGAGAGTVGAGTGANGGAPASASAVGLDINGMTGGTSPAGFGVWGGGGGGRSNTGNGVGATFGGYSLYGGAGGGGGAQIDALNAPQLSARGGTSGALVNTITGGSGAGGATNTNGNPGTAFGPYTGGGGGGGGAALTGNPGNGAVGYVGCGGGGGGAASTTANAPTGGNGGNGGDGRIIVVTYF